MKPVTVLLLISSVCASLVPKVDFRFQKHIVFSSVGGGSSHNVWMLEVLKELHSRNHTVSFFSRGDHLSFADDYPMVKRYEVGGPLDFAIVAAMSNSLPDHPDPITTARVVIESSVGNYTQEFHHTRDLSEKLRIDMFVCDSFAIACIDAAITMKKPVMITSTFGFYKDLQAPYLNNKLHSGPYPTTAEESTWTRFYRDYILVPIMEYKLQFRLSETAKTQESLGFSFTVDSTSPRYNAISKMIHNVYGIESPKSLTPLDHYVGPIMRSSYPKLDNITQNFLDNHQRVVYVGFGQHAQAYKADLELILPSLLKLKKEGVIDGIIWARLSSEVPKDKDILLPGWAPQFAILQHPSISFFISHGGMASVVESLYNGVRLFVYPFFGDQPINARAIKQNGLGEYFDMMTDDKRDFHTRLSILAADPEKKFQRAVDRFKAYVQISSIHSTSKVADLVEENAFACDEEGQLGYRQHVKYGIPWVKRYNLDIYLVFMSLPCVLFYVFYTGNTRSNLKKSKMQ